MEKVIEFVGNMPLPVIAGVCIMVLTILWTGVENKKRERNDT